jgi:hypothetical protein
MKGANQALADSVFLAVKGYVDVAFDRIFKLAIAPFEKRLDDLPKALHGKDADADAIAAEVLGKVTKALEAIPAPKDGRDGIDGKSVDEGRLLEQITEAVTKAAQELPPAPAGKDGENGKDASPEQIEAAVAKAVAELPKPKDGIDGKDGTSVSLDDVKAMLSEMVTKAIADIPVQKGEPGKDGESIDPELVRAELQKMVDAIPRPVDGLRGEKGEDGRDGRDAKGEPGRDALQIDILPAIDETRIYPRATYAHLRGGVVRSIRTTEPMVDGDFEKAGWVIFIDGETDYDVTQANERSFTVRREMLSGKVFERSFDIPALVDREVYREGEEYKRGDGVTWGRHFWIARRDTKAKPEGGDDWRLAVKAGRDGADAFWVAKRNGFAGSEAEWLASLRGKEGKPGKDLTLQTGDGRKY